MQSRARGPSNPQTGARDCAGYQSFIPYLERWRAYGLFSLPLSASYISCLPHLAPLALFPAFQLSLLKKKNPFQIRKAGKLENEGFRTRSGMDALRPSSRLL